MKCPPTYTIATRVEVEVRKTTNFWCGRRCRQHLLPHRAMRQARIIQSRLHVASMSLFRRSALMDMPGQRTFS